jgi:hypothetical protein
MAVPEPRHFGERADESVVRRIDDLGADPIALGAERTSDDAGAELAEDFGREFLVAATTGEDIGEIESAAAEASEKEGLGLHEVEIDALEDVSEFAVVDDE